MSKKAKDTDNTEQHGRFIETARALGCDENPAVFDEKLKVIARHIPLDRPAPAPKPALLKRAKKHTPEKGHNK